MASTTTTTPAPKRQRTSGPEAYELLYWPGIPGRGEFVRLAFEATGTPYTDVSNASKGAAGAMIKLVRPDEDSDPAAEDAANPPPLAPPMLRHGPTLISQTPSILLYLGPRLGLVPAAAEDEEGAGACHVHSLALTALDGFSNEAHDTHHPVAVGEFYDGQKDEAKRRARDYAENRLPKFLAHFERVLGGAASRGGEWLYGGRMTYADLVLFQGLDGVSFAFPKCVERFRQEGRYDKVWALYERVKALDRVKEYLASERRLPYGNGIWRHYPELEE